MDYAKAWQFLREDLKELFKKFDLLGNDNNKSEETTKDDLENVQPVEEIFELNYDKYDHKLETIDSLLTQMKIYETIIDAEIEIDDEFELKGFDWVELSQAIGVYEEYNLSEEDTLTKNILENYIKVNFDNQAVIDKCKEHLNKVVIDIESNEIFHDDYAKVWRALLEIEDNYIFMQFMSVLVSLSWT